MKKYIIFLFLIFLSGIGYSQTFDSSFTVFNSLRGNVWFKKSNVPSYLIDGYRAKIVNGDTLVRGNFGVLRAEEIEVYSDGSDMASAFQSAIDFTAVNWVSFGSDSVRSYIFASSINVHGKTLDFSNGNKLVASGSISVDSLTYRASDYDQVFEGDITFTNLKSATGYITPQHFGAKADGSTDVTAPTQKALSVENVIIKFPPGAYYTTDSLTLTWSSVIQMPTGSIIMSATTDRPAIIAGDYTTDHLVAMRGKEYEFRVERVTQSNWADSNSIGVKLVNLNYSKVKVMVANKFTIGMKTVGYNAGFAYVDFDLGVFEKNLIGVKIATESPSSLAWNNQNTYKTGWFRNGSENTGVQTFGVWVGNGDYAVTNNVFENSSFEMRSNSIPFYIQSGTRNKSTGFRSEGNSDTVVYIANRTGNSNTWNYFFAGRDGGVGFMVDSSNTGKNFYSSAERAYNEKTNYTTVAALDDIAGLCSYSGDDSSVNIRYPGLFQYRTGASLTYPVSTMDTTVKMENDYLVMDANHLYGISTNYIDVSIIKSFIVKQSTASGSSSASVGVILYDSRGVNISSTSKIQSSLTFTSTSTYGSSLIAANSNGNDVNITVPSSAATMRVFLYRNSGTVKAKSFRVVSHDPLAPMVYANFNGQKSYNTSPTKPSIGSYLQNTIILNSAPAKDSPYAWVCTDAGSFGELPPVTGAISNNSNKLVLSSGGGSLLHVGDILQIGSKRLQVRGVDADTAYLNGTAPSTLTGITIDYAVPNFEVLHYIDETPGGGVTIEQVSELVHDSLSSNNLYVQNVGDGDTILVNIDDTTLATKSLKAGVGVITPTDTTLVFNISGSEYVASLTNSTNVASSTGADFRYIRAGNIVMVSGKVSVTPTAGTANTIIRVSLPIASALASGADLWGSGSATETTRVVVDVEGTDATDEAIISFTSISTSAHIVKVHFTYTIN